MRGNKTQGTPASSAWVSPRSRTPQGDMIDQLWEDSFDMNTSPTSANTTKMTNRSLLKHKTSSPSHVIIKKAKSSRMPPKSARSAHNITKSGKGPGAALSDKVQAALKELEDIKSEHCNSTGEFNVSGHLFDICAWCLCTGCVCVRVHLHALCVCVYEYFAVNIWRVY
jgi:hypothetical protein